MKYKLLETVANYSPDRIEVSKLDLENYISTENMLTNKAGIVSASKLPTGKTTPAYQKGDILISNIRPYFKKIWYAENDGGCSNDVLVIRANQEIHSKFLFYALADDNFFEYDVANSKGTKMPRGDKTAIMRYKIPDLSFDEQQAIAETLSALDKRIAENKKINHHLVDLIDTQFAEFQSTNEFPEKARLRDLFNTQTGTFNPKKSDEIEVRHFSIPAFDATSYPVIDEVTSIKSNKNIVSKYSVLFSKLNPTTKRVWVPFIKGELLSVASTEFLSLSGKTPSEQAMIFAIINSNDFQDYFKAHATGTTNSRQRTSPDVAYDYELPYDSGRFDEFGIQLAPLVEQIQNNSDEIQQLIKIRDFLLPKLMSGEISVID